MKHVRAWIVVPSMLIGLGCAADVDDDRAASPSHEMDELETATEALCGGALATTIDPDAPIFLYYGAYGRSAGQRATLNLVSSGAAVGGEAVLAINREERSGCGEPWRDLTLWRERGGKVAHVIGQNRGGNELRDLLARPDGIDELIETFHAGFHYVAIDEVAMLDAGWVDGGDLAAGFRYLVEELARRGYDRRVILYVNSYNIVTADRVRDYSDVLTACRDHCRVLASEVYIHTRYVMDRPHTDVCNGNVDCFETALRRFENLAPGISGRAISILGLSSSNAAGAVHYNDPDHPYPLCDGPGGGGALRRQYDAATAGPFGRRQPGIGAYTLARVRHPGFSERQSECLRALNGDYDWPRASSAAPAPPAETPPPPEAPPASTPLGAHSHAHVACQLFDDGYANATPHVQKLRANGDAVSTVCDAHGRCRRWFGRCVTAPGPDGHQHTVRMVGLGADGAVRTGLTDAVIPLGTHDIRISGAADPQVYWRGVVDAAADGHAHAVRCTVYDGDTPIASGDAVTRFDVGTTPRSCVPGDGLASCGVWVRCMAE